MAKYRFPNFNVEIENPTIEIDMKTIGDNTVDKLLKASITLTCGSSKLYGVRLTGMPYKNGWNDSDIPEMVEQKLKEYEV